MSEQPLSGQRAVPARALTAGYRFRLPALAGAPADPPPPRQRAREGDGAGRAPPPLAAG